MKDSVDILEVYRYFQGAAHHAGIPGRWVDDWVQEAVYDCIAHPDRPRWWSCRAATKRLVRHWLPDECGSDGTMARKVKVGGNPATRRTRQRRADRYKEAGGRCDF